MTTFALAVLDPGGERVGGEAAEDHGVRGADAGRRPASRPRSRGSSACRSRPGRPSADAEVGQRVGGLADLVLELGVGDVAGVVLGLAHPVAARPCRRCPASTCRSTQLYAALSVPPTNHFANGGSSQSRTWSHFWSQSSRSACSAQNASRSASARVVRLRLDVGVRGEVRRRLEAALLVEQVGQGLVRSSLTPSLTSRRWTSASAGWCRALPGDEGVLGRPCAPECRAARSGRVRSV